MNTVHQVGYNVPFIIVIDFLPGMLLYFFMCACLLNNYRKKIDVVISVHKNDPTFKPAEKTILCLDLKTLYLSLVFPIRT